jgi:hypothetical protein
MNRCLSIYGFVLIGLAAVLFMGSGLLAQEIEVKMEDGIPVVYNPKEPVPIDGVSVKLTLKHELTIGRESGDENFVFLGLQIFAVDDQERICVLDWKDNTKVKIFDTKGNNLCSFGKGGKGPGEMSRPTRLIDVPGGGIAVLDSGSKLVFFSPEGELLKEVPLGKYASLRRYLIDSDGYIYGHVWSFDETKATAKFMKFSPVLEPLETLASFEQKIMPRVFRPFTEEFFIKLTANGNLLWAVPSEYKITILDRDGKILKRIIKDYDPVKITAADREELIKATFGERGVRPDIKVDFPKHFPAIRHIAGGGDGRIYVRTHDYIEGEDGRLFRHDVFDAEGRYLTKFYHAFTETVMWIYKDKLYTRVEESAGGMEKVKIYSLIWE